MKRIVIISLKIGLSAAIIAYLIFDAVRSKDGGDVFGDMLRQPKRWDLLAAAWLCVAAAVVITLVRWCYLVRALGIALGLRDALRIGLLGFLFNLAPAGIVGGDLLKGVMLSHEHPGNRAKSAASVIMDRVIGLYVLFVVATAGILLTGFAHGASPSIYGVCQGVWVLTLVGTVGLGAVLVPGLIEGRLIARLAGRGRVWHAIESLLEAVRMYRRNLRVLAGAMVMSVAVHLLFAMAIYLTAHGLGVTELPLDTAFAIGPTSSIASTVPLPAGPLEGALVFFFTESLGIPKGRGLVVALVFRLINISIAVVGFAYYLGSRREVAEVIHEAEQDEPTDCVSP